MEFIKYEAAGNDFLAFDAKDLGSIDYSSLARQACHRKFGLGADGILVARKSQKADIEMLYFNRDGSQGEMCGNGIRSFSKYIYEENILKNEKMRIETLDGIKNVDLDLEDEQIDWITVNMGQAYFRPDQIPVDLDGDQVINQTIYIDQGEYKFSALRLGVPHMVIFVKDIGEIDIDHLGSQLEKDPLFPRGINVNFVEIVNSGKIKIYSWERGVGRTLGCGTGSCASVLIGHRLFLLASRVQVETEGGDLEVELKDDRIFMKGRANYVARGSFNYRGEE